MRADNKSFLFLIGSTSGSIISSAAVITDNALVRGDGGARGVQSSDIIVSDVASNVTTVSTIASDLKIGAIIGTGAQAVFERGASGSITLTPSGTGQVKLTGTGLTGSGLLNLATHTTSAGGVGFGTDATIYRSAAGTLTFGATTASTSTTTGSLINAGGFGNAGAAFIGGNLNVAGTGAVGIANNSAIGFYVQPSALAGTAQYGIISNPVFTSSATSFGRAAHFAVQTAAASFTMANGYALRLSTPVLGVGSAITTQTALYVDNQGVTGVANAVGIDIASQSGASSANIGLRNAGVTSLTNTTASTSTTTGSLVNAGGFGNAGAGYFGADVNSASYFLSSRAGTDMVGSGAFKLNGVTNYSVALQQAANGDLMFQTYNNSAWAERWRISQPGVLSGTNITDATTGGAGSITTAGGIYAAKKIIADGTIMPQRATTAGAPAYVLGAIYFDTTLNKLRVGGASAWETITSV